MYCKILCATAPDNCLQYFMTATGTIMSFNFLFAATPLVQHLAYQDYTICIRANQVQKLDLQKFA